MAEIDPHLPIDKTAALVVSRSKDQGLEHKCGSKIVSMVPLPTTMFNGPKKDDLTGCKAGRFTVVGCALWKPTNHKKSSNNTRWVVRCSCGRYQMLTTKAVKKNHPNLACIECERNYSRTVYEPKRLLRNIGIIAVLFFISISLNAQSSSIPNVILDSMIFEVKRGRQCELVMQDQAIELEKQGLELVHTNTALKLSQSSNQTLSDLLNNSKESNSIQALQFQKDLSEQKRKTKRWRRIGIVQAVVIIGIVLIK